MARRTFFSFHYERDVWRAGQVRNSWRTQPDRDAAGFWDGAAWEAVKRNGNAAIKKWIDNQLLGTSVTVVLIGAETADREYVGYEIEQSHQKGNGILGIYIHNMKDVYGRPDTRGRNPFDNWQIDQGGRKVLFSSLYPTYDWVNNDGYHQLGNWIEAAARQAGR